MPRFRLLVFSIVLLGAHGVFAGEPKPLPYVASAGARTRATTPGELTMLSEALHKTANDFHRWAYTERRLMRDDKGKVKSDTLLRFDPSQPYAEQWTPIKIDG